MLSTQFEKWVKKKPLMTFGIIFATALLGLYLFLVIRLKKSRLTNRGE
jgi:hypothetical protein